MSEIPELKPKKKKIHKRRKRIRNGLFLLLAFAVIVIGILYFFDEFPVSRWQGDENIAEGSGSMMSALGEGFTDRQITDGVSAVLAAQDASDTLGFANAFDELSVYVSATVDNECYYRLQQYYNGIPVYQRYVTVIATESGDALGIFTDATDISGIISLTPTITNEETKESIQEYAKVYWEVVYDDMIISELSDDRLVIYNLEDSESACLAYELTVFNDEEYHVILDAQNGEVLDCISTINEVSGIGTNVDGTLSFPVDYDEESDTYTIFDEEQQIYLFNLYGEDCTEALAGDAFDETAFENRKITSVGDNIFGNSEEEIDQDAETAVNLVTNIGLVIEYFENTFGQEAPYESMLLTYNDGYDEGNNACAGPAIFTEDESVYGFLSIGLALDGTESHVLAHEYTHLIEDYYSAATGSNSDYGINEGLADTFACFYTLDWDIDLTMIGGTHRNAVDPSEYGYPASILEKYQADSDDIHAYATVISHAAYLMYDSGNFTMEELQQLWYKTLLKLPANCTYYDLRMCMEQTAIISGYSSEQQGVVSDVYDEIGIYDRYSCANSIDLFIYDKQGNLYDDCTVIISGETARGLFGIGSKSYDLTLLWDSSEACNIELDDGTYEITIIDNANSSVETGFSIEVDDSNADQSLYAFDYGADYVAVSGAELIVLDVDGNEFSDYSASASMDGDSRELESGLIDLPIGNYYRIVLKSRDDSAGVTYYKMFTLRVKDDAENKVTVETSFSGMESGTDDIDGGTEASDVIGTWEIDADRTMDENQLGLTQIFGSAYKYGNSMILEADGGFTYYVGAGVGGESIWQLDNDQIIFQVTIYGEDTVESGILTFDNNGYLVMQYMEYTLYWKKTSNASDKTENSENTGSTGTVFEILPETFEFTAGVGNWSTTLCINDDGTFSGRYYDLDMGESDNEYPNGTKYICDFSGCFSNATQIDDYVYSIIVKSIEWGETAGTPYIEDGYKYIQSEPYGLAEGDQLLIYLPGCPISKIEDYFVDWISALGLIDQGEDVLSECYGIYNQSDTGVFFAMVE